MRASAEIFPAIGEALGALSERSSLEDAARRHMMGDEDAGGSGCKRFLISYFLQAAAFGFVFGVFPAVDVDNS